MNFTIFSREGSSSGDWIKEMIIFTSWGQKVFQVSDILLGTPEHSWSVSQAGAGLYFFQATVLDKNKTLTRLVGRIVLVE